MAKPRERRKNKARAAPRCWRQMGSAGRYCLETKLAKLAVGGGAPAGVKVSRAKSPTRLVRCWNQDAGFQQGAGLPTCLVSGPLPPRN